MLKPLPDRTLRTVRVLVARPGAPRQRKKRPSPVAWSPAEETLLRLLYPVATWPSLLRALPARSFAAIQDRGISLGLRPRTPRHLRHVEPPETYTYQGERYLVLLVDDTLACVVDAQSGHALLAQRRTLETLSWEKVS